MGWKYEARKGMGEYMMDSKGDLARHCKDNWK